MQEDAAPPARIGDYALRLVDSITEIGPWDAHGIVISGSHGGRSVVPYVLAVPLALVCFNDAGVGKDRAGIAALDLLAAAGVACVTVSHASARIGDARDAWDHGTVSFVNTSAQARGWRVEAPLRLELERLFG